MKSNIEITGSGLTIEQVNHVLEHRATVSISEDPGIIRRINDSQSLIEELSGQGQVIYGVTTNFGGMADSLVDGEEIASLQSNLIWGLKCGTGESIAARHVVSAMICRLNSLVRGASGIRMEILQRLSTFINSEATPIVYKYGSIGASGDLVPLAHIAGALIGLDDQFSVQYHGEILGGKEVGKLLDLAPIKLKAKEGLALVNGTSVSTGIAINAFFNFSTLFNSTLYIHAFLITALEGHAEAFHPFVHEQKPHPGQVSVAEMMWQILASTDNNLKSKPSTGEKTRLVQDRYSIRCLPQFLGPIHEGLQHIKASLEVELNSTNDNPIIDTESKHVFHTGNFLGQHVAINMDQLRYYIALLSKHVDAQVSLVMSPEFSHGLPASLCWNGGGGSVKFGLKGLQISMNSMASMLTYYGNTHSHLFSTHCEQFNQNINSLSYGAANLAWDAVTILQDYLSMALLIGIQAVELRAYETHLTCDARCILPIKMVGIYEEVYSILERDIQPDKPLISNNAGQSLSVFVKKISKHILSLFSSSPVIAGTNTAVEPSAPFLTTL